jgi:hypothetical protein
MPRRCALTQTDSVHNHTNSLVFLIMELNLAQPVSLDPGKQLATVLSM